MKGCRPLKPSEIRLISAELTIRDRCIFILGIRTGFRISELLSINVGDVVDEGGRVRGTVVVQKRNTKGKTCGMAVPLHHEAVGAIQALLRVDPGDADDPLFRSEVSGGRGGGRLCQSVFRKALKKALSRASIQDAHLVSTHSLRKSYAARMYEALDKNIFKLQRAMRHQNIDSTTKYIGVDDEEIGNAILKVK